jgi:predicted branched-subunit amino acid permease
MRAATRSAFLLGLRDGSPFVIVIVPFAMLFGLVASEAGWTLAQIMAMTVLVIAGASQFTAVQLVTENAPTLVVILAALAVNLRMAMYSASLALHIGAAPLWQRAAVAYVLVDQNYGTAMIRYAERPLMSVPERVAYLLGAAAALAPLWYAFTWVGAVAGTAIPEGLAIDFAVPIAFIAMVAPGLRDTPHVAAAVAAVVAALLLAGLPYSLGLLVASGIGMGVGAGLDGMAERRA